jgi:hypothetical protein
VSDQGRAEAWDAGRRLFEVLREQAEPGDEVAWGDLSEATRAYYERVAQEFVAEYHRVLVRDYARLYGTRPPDEEAPRGDEAWGRE